MEKYSLQNLNLARIHLVGIGGAGQNALADILLDLGYAVSGSDLKLSATTAALQKRGATIYAGHSTQNLNNSTLVVTTAAAQSDNIELVAARQLGLPVLQNAEMTGLLLNQQPCLLAIAGTHGKTTTSGLVAYLLKRLELDPTWYIGAVVSGLGKAGQAGKGGYAVVEADEYAERFLNYQPTHALITNIEADHLDYYGSMANLRTAFAKFAQNWRPAGNQNAGLYFCADDSEAANLANQLRHSLPVNTYGLNSSELVSPDWLATNLKNNSKGAYSFDLVRAGQGQGQVDLALPGLHNVRNALGALALVLAATPLSSVSELCKYAGEYSGAARRFELKGVAHDITVVDDYAHHPTEIRATLQAARARYGNRRLVALFQPHTYSRTKALLDEFAAAFTEADVVGIMEIFPARETDTLGVSTADILFKMNHIGKINQPLSHSNVVSELKPILRPGDVLLTLGAGDVWQVGEQILKG